MELSKYELEREERIRRNREELLKLDIPILTPRKPEPSVTKKASSGETKKRRKPPVVEERPRRVSLRSRGLAPDGAEAIKKEAELIAQSEPERKRHVGTEPLTEIIFGDDFEDIEDANSEAEKKEKFVSKFFATVSYDDDSDGVQKQASKAEVGDDEEQEASDKRLSRFVQMQIWSEDMLRKMTARRIYSLLAHPTADKLLVAAGDNHGHFSMWQVQSNGDHASSILPLEPHTSPITSIRMGPQQSHAIYTSSHDGNVRMLDLAKQEFTTVYEDKDLDAMNDLSFAGPQTCGFCTRSGYVGLLDFRTPKKLLWEIQLHEKKVGAVCIHADSNVLVTASNDTTAGVFDLRSLGKGQKKPLVTLQHNRAISGASLAPNGDKIVTTCYDDQIRVFSKTKGVWDSKPRSYRHDNNTGRWISSFSAQWHPSDEGIFVCGSKTRPHGIDVFDTSITSNRVIGRFTSDYLTAIPARHAFHEPTGILVMGNASGKVFVCSPSANL